MFKMILNLAQEFFRDHETEDFILIQAIDEAIRHSEALLHGEDV